MIKMVNDLLSPGFSESEGGGKLPKAAQYISQKDII
jgi:hypothetical protein